MDNPPRIPGYRIEEEIGKGAMARVFRAIQETLERQVALKITSPELMTDAAMRERFVKEGKIMSQFSHLNIITVYDSGTWGPLYFLAMEYIHRGRTLKDCIRRGLPVVRSVAILKALACALGYAHARGFIHRDVKPANILLREDHTPVLADFGIAKALDGAGAHITRTGWTAGTPNYMSPEQALGDPLDERSDLYSLGVVFFEMLTGSKPFAAPDHHLHQPIPRLPTPLRCFQDIVNQLMAKHPQERFASAQALIEALEILGSAWRAPAPNGRETTILVPTHQLPDSGLGNTTTFMPVLKPNPQGETRRVGDPQDNSQLVEHSDPGDLTPPQDGSKDGP
ncbi:MAG: serine/threonine-protein kinase [Candidatus Competibacterales bacterium]